MSKRRHVLEDSDSSDDDASSPAPGGAAGVDHSDFFSEEEIVAITRCNIQVNDDGKYSEECMNKAIKGALDLLDKVETGGDSHEKFCVKKKEKGLFLDRHFYKVHDGDDPNKKSPSEEAILLEVEVLRRSQKPVKHELFKRKTTGGMVVFGPWWNYCLKRLLDLHSDANTHSGSLEDYTAVKIMRSLFDFIVKDLNDVVKQGKLGSLKKMFGVDWTKNVQHARKVINHCGPSHLLDGELSAVEAHVENLKGGDKPAPTAKAEARDVKNSLAAGPTAPSASAADSESAAKKRQMRMQNLRAKSLKRGSSSVAESGVLDSASPAKSAALASAGAREVQPQRHEVSRSTAPPRSVADPPRMNDGTSQNSFQENRRSPEVAPHGGEDGTHSRPTRPSAKSSSLGTSGVIDDGWGRKRDGISSDNTYKTKGSWKFSRGTLGHDIPVGETSRKEDPSQPGQGAGGGSIRSGNNMPSPPERSVSGSNFGRCDQGNRHQGRSDRFDNRHEDRRDSGVDRHLSQQNNNNNNNKPTSNERSSDFRRDAGRGNETSTAIDDGWGRNRDQDYRRSNSRGEEYRNRGDEHGQSRRQSSSRDHVGSGHGQGLEQSRSYDRDGGPPEKRSKSSHDPGASASYSASASNAGPGRTSSNQPANIYGNGHRSTNPGSGGAGAASPWQTNTSTGMTSHGGHSVNPAAPNMQPARRGSGRGIDNRPAWMAEKERSSAHNGPSPMPSNGASSTHLGAGVAQVTSRGASSLSQSQHHPAEARAPVAPAANPHPSRAVNPPGPTSGSGRGRGRGRGRGKEKNLPAWMTRNQNA